MGLTNNSLKLSYTFTASTNTIVFSGYYINDLSDINVITNVTDGIVIYNFADGITGTFTASTQTLVLTYNTASMSDTDVLQINLATTIGDDVTTDASKNIQLNSLPTQYDTPSPILTTALTLTTSMQLVGTETPMNGRTAGKFFVTYTAGTSVDLRFQILVRDTFGSATTYTMNPQQWRVTNSFDNALGTYKEVEVDTNNTFEIPFFPGNNVASVALYASVGTVGWTPQITACSVALSWSGVANFCSEYKQDPATKALCVTDYSHCEIHSWDHYFYTDYDTDVDTAAPKYYRLTTPNTTKWIHMLIETYSEWVWTWQLFENPTVNAAGTTATVFNNNRNSSNVAWLVVAFDPTSTADWTLIKTWRTWSWTTAPTRQPWGSRSDEEIVLKQNEDYFLKFTPDSNDCKTVLELDWYEHTSRL